MKAKSKPAIPANYVQLNTAASITSKNYIKKYGAAKGMRMFEVFKEMVSEHRKTHKGEY